MQQFLKKHVGALLIWLLILVVALFGLPDVNQLTRAHGSVSLPRDVQSEVAKSIRDDWGKKKKNTYEVALVFNKKGQLSKKDKAAINQTLKRITDHPQKYGVKDSLLPDSNIATRKKLQASDGTTWVAQFNISKKHGTIAKIKDQLTKASKTKGIRTYITGADVLNDDFSASIQEGIKKTEAITVVFIFIVLIIVFKSPIVPLISLLTVGLSFLTSFSIVTNLVDKANFPFSNFTQVFMVIVLFGIGTDYNILLYDKFKEDLALGMDKYEASRDAIKQAGKTILYSGSSILIGFSALGLAKFSIYQSACGVAVGVFVLLLVLLTLNPFFMTTLGSKLFWPVKKFEGESQSKLWRTLSASALKHPVVHILLTLIITLPMMLAYNGKLNYDDTDEISNATPSKAGLQLVQKHFSKGMAMPTYVYIRADHRLDNEHDLYMLDQLVQKFKKQHHVNFATGVTQPYGEKIKRLYVKEQLKTVNSGMTTMKAGTGKLQRGSETLTGAVTQLYAGATQINNGLLTMKDRLNGQMTPATANQLSQLEQGLPKINAGVQQLNGALQNNASQVDVTGLKAELTNIASQAQTIANNLSSAGNTLQGLTQAGAGVDASALAAQYGQAEAAAKLTPAQKQVMDQALAQIVQGINSTAAAQTNAVAGALGNVGGNLQAAGQADQSLGASLSKVANSAKQLQGLSAELTKLKAAVNELAGASKVALPGAAQALNTLASGVSQVQSATGQAQAGTGQLQQGLGQVKDQTPALANGLGKISAGMDQADSYLTGLQSSKAADSFYMPSKYLHNRTFQKSIAVYLSPDKKSAQFIVVFDTNPSATSTSSRAQALQTLAKKTLAGTDLANAKVAVGGQSSVIKDTRQIASSDFVRTAIIMLVGIGLALIFVTRSLLQPVFILGTLMIAYLSSLSINQLLVKLILGKQMLTWNTPFFSFIMLIALGVDYSIFLMMRYRSEDGGLLASQKMLHSCTVIGTVVISAAIILAGTFAALMPSGIPTLIEVALTVIIGLALLVILMPIILSATVKLTYEGFAQKNK